MRMSKLVGQRIKETPKDAVSASHIFFLRGGYVRPLSTGIYSQLPLAQRVLKKVENIIREEMEKVESQELLMPLVNPKEIWQESGRYDSVDQTLLRFQDRNNKDLVLAMTHEEAICHMAKTELTSYKQLPFSVFQIQTKYRDEARPRAGLIRVREFKMKDAYSFHETEECLAAYYNEVHAAYERIFKRLGMTEVLSVEADSGMIGGSVSHEFMGITDIGEDTIIASPCRKYLANREIATSSIVLKQEDAGTIEKIQTPEAKTIEEVASFLGTELSDSAKAVLYESHDSEDLIFALIRGDIEVNEIKLKNFLKLNTLFPASEERIAKTAIVPGYASPYGIDLEGVRVVVDPTVADSSNLICGANEEHMHFKNFNYRRDCDGIGEIVDIATVRAGDPCPITGAPLEELRGIEVGNIFQLGDKYSKAMDVKYLNQQGKAQIPVMGCYGIGVGRAMATVCEQSHDKYGPIWPLSIAPFQVHIIGLNPNKEEIGEKAQALYKELQSAGLEVLLDDRAPKPGPAFNDADLIGVPYRVVISPKTVKDGEIEFSTRDKSINERVKIADAAAHVIAIVKAKLAE